MAETTSPAGGGETLTSKQTSPDSAQKETFILGAAGDTSIRPFQFRASDEDLADLKRRILATRWPDRETVDDDTQGVQLATMQKLADYWATEYDWRKIEARLNAFPNFITEIDGLDIHFIHVRSKHENALPIIVTHGWPGSIVEQLKIIEPLTDPTAHGGTAEDAFDVVIPSIPGYGFSARPTAAGWNPPRIAQAWITLMKRLGYTRFAGAGRRLGRADDRDPGRDGAAGTGRDPHQHAVDRAAGNLRGAARRRGPARRSHRRREAAPTSGSSSSSPTASLTRTRWATARRRLYGIADSPVGLAAWFLDHDISSYQMIARAFDGEPEGLTRDDVLDNITITWLTNTAISGARLYWEALPRTSSGFGIEKNNVHFFEPIGVRVPIAVSAVPRRALTRRREAGRNGSIPSSSITTSCPRAGISPPSSSRNSWSRS